MTKKAEVKATEVTLAPIQKLGFRTGTTQEAVVNALLAGNETVEQIIARLAKEQGKEEKTLRSTVSVFLSDLTAPLEGRPGKTYGTERNLDVRLINDKGEDQGSYAENRSGRKIFRAVVTAAEIDRAAAAWAEFRKAKASKK